MLMDLQLADQPSLLMRHRLPHHLERRHSTKAYDHCQTDKYHRPPFMLFLFLQESGNLF
jgi:hypothetical protein